MPESSHNSNTSRKKWNFKRKIYIYICSVKKCCKRNNLRKKISLAHYICTWAHATVIFNLQKKSCFIAVKPYWHICINVLTEKSLYCIRSICCVCIEKLSTRKFIKSKIRYFFPRHGAKIKTGIRSGFVFLLIRIWSRISGKRIQIRRRLNIYFNSIKPFLRKLKNFYK